MHAVCSELENVPANMDNAKHNISRRPIVIFNKLANKKVHRKMSVHFPTAPLRKTHYLFIHININVSTVKCYPDKVVFSSLLIFFFFVIFKQ